jgi:inner membrane protein
MCTPIGHSLVGLSLYLGVSDNIEENRKKSWFIVLFFLLLANLPDLDFLPGFFSGNPNLYHHKWTHSLLFMVLTGFMVGLAARFIFHKDGFKWVWLSALFVFSHLVLDFLTLDQRPPIGIPLFWPLSQAHLISPLTIFSDVSRSSSSVTFFRSLFIPYNFRTVLIEILYLGPILIFMLRWQSVHKTGGERG